VVGLSFQGCREERQRQQTLGVESCWGWRWAQQWCSARCLRSRGRCGGRVGVVGKKKTSDTVRTQGGDVGKWQGTCGV
jgi:hypothetical protein